MELDPEEVRRLGLDPAGPKTRELSAAEMKLMGLNPEGPGSLINQARVAGTAAVGGLANAAAMPSNVNELGGDAMNWVMRKLGIISKTREQQRADLRKVGITPTEDYLPSVSKTVESVGIPTDFRKEAARLGEPMTRGLESVADAIQTATGTLPYGGPLMALLSGVGAGAGRAVFGETGSIIGALAAPLAIPARANRLASLAAKPASTETILKDAGTALDAFKLSDAAVNKNAFGRFAAVVEQRLRGEPIIDRALQPKTVAVFDSIQKKAADPNMQGATMGELWGIRRTINKALERADPDDARLLKGIKSDLDKFVFTARNATDSLYGNVERSAGHLKEGIQKYAQGQAAKELEQMIEVAKTTSRGWQAPSLDRALRNEFKKVVNNPDELRRFPKDAQIAMKLVVDGTPLRNALRFVGKFSPMNVIPGGAYVGLAASGEDDWAVPLAALAGLSRGASNRMGMATARRAVETVQRGGPAPARRSYLPLAPALGVFSGQ